MNNKGQFSMLYVTGFVLFMMIIMFFAFAFTVGSGVLMFASESLHNITSELGTSTSDDISYNLTQYSDFTITPINTIIQKLSWFSALLIVGMLMSILMLATAVRVIPSKWFIGLFLLLIIVVMFTSIYISNFYEEVYSGNDEIGTTLKTMGAASFLMIYLPELMAVISFIGGVIIFTGLETEEGFG